MRKLSWAAWALMILGQGLAFASQIAKTEIAPPRQEGGASAHYSLRCVQVGAPLHGQTCSRGFRLKWSPVRRPAGADTATPNFHIVVPGMDTTVGTNPLPMVVNIDGELRTHYQTLKSGANAVILQASNEYGNFAFDTVNVFLDDVPPVIANIVPAPGSWVRTSILGVSYTGDGTPYSRSFILQEGPNPVVLDATDAFGNATRDTVIYKLDTQAPNVVIVNPSVDTIVKVDSIQLRYTVDGQSVSRWTKLVSGNNVLIAQAADSAGNQGADTVQVRYVPGCKPVIAVIPTQVAQLGQQFRALDLSGYVSDCAYGLSQLTFQASGGVNVTAAMSGTKILFTLPNGNWYGTDSLKLVVSDPDGLRDSTMVRMQHKNTLTLNALVRDFKERNTIDTTNNHPDFQPPVNSCSGIGDLQRYIKITGADPDDRNPVQLPGNTNCYRTRFSEWYTTSQDTLINRPFQINLNFVDGGNGTIKYNNTSFFPIDKDSVFIPVGKTPNTFGQLQSAFPTHDYGFTMEFHAEFQYKKGSGQIFKFTGDDDVWVYIHDSLVIDLGGIHGPLSDSVKLDNLPAGFLADGQEYPLDFFSAERHTSGSNILITTSLGLSNAQSQISLDKKNYPAGTTTAQVTLVNKSQGPQIETRAIELISSKGDTLRTTATESATIPGKFTKIITLANGAVQLGDTVLQITSPGTLVARYIDPDYGDTTVSTSTYGPQNVVAITSPARNQLFNHSPVPVAWNVNGLAQTTQLTANLAQGANRIIRSFTDTTGTSADTVNVSLDSIPPHIAGTGSPVDGNHGWYRNFASVSFACSDETQLVFCSAPASVTSNGRNIPVTGQARDSAGNVRSTTVFISRDAVPPALASASIVQVPLHGSAQVTLNLAASDSLSGLESLVCNGHPVALNRSPLAYVETLPAGTQNISCTAVDSAGNSLAKTFILNVVPNQAPVARQDNYSVPAGDSLSVPAKGVLANDSDFEADTLHALLARATTHGASTLNADGSVKYKPAAGFAGLDSLAYRATDGKDTSASAWAVFNVIHVPLTLIITDPAEGFLTRFASVAVDYTVNGISHSRSFALAEGVNHLVVDTLDDLGHIISDTVVVRKDGIPPLVHIGSPANGSATNQNPIAIAWTADGVAQTSGTSQTLLAGTNVIRRAATDSAGNQGADSIVVIYDTVPPVVKILSPQNNVTVNDSVIAVNWTVDGVAQANGTSAHLAEGDNVIVRTAADTVGNVGRDSVHVFRSSCFTVADDSVHFHEARTYACIDVQSGGSLYAHQNLTAKSVLVEAGGTLFTDDTLRADTLSIEDGGVVTHTAWLSDDMAKQVYIIAAKVRVAQGGAIDVTKKGYPNGVGPYGLVLNMYYSGGSHGGLGANGEIPVYDDLRRPIMPGSGGGPIWLGYGWAGMGGGIVRIEAQSLILDGKILADGETQVLGSGAGGSVWLNADHYTGNGSVSANGGQAPPLNGGGGRIAMYGCDIPQNLRDSASVAGFQSGSLFLACYDNPRVHISFPADSALVLADHTPVLWSVDGQPQPVDTAASLPEGWNSIGRCYTNNYGHTGCDTSHVRVNLHAPVVRITSPGRRSYAHNYYVDVEWTIDGVPQTADTIAYLSEGPNLITRSYADATGATGSDSVVVIVDNTPPKIELINPGQSATIIGPSFNLRWMADSVEQSPVHHVMDTSGANNIVLHATDSAGNTDSLLAQFYSGGLVPNIVGLPHASADSLLAQNVFTPDSIWVNNDSVPSGIVFSQTPAAGDSLRFHWRVHYKISRGLDAVDLVPLALDAANMTVDPLTLAAGGSVRVVAANQGRAGVHTPIDVLIFEDRDRDHKYSPAADLLLGRTQINTPLAAQDSVAVNVPVTGNLTFNGNRISVMLDYPNTIAETHEDNNVTQSHASCVKKPMAMDYTPILKWGWRDTTQEMYSAIFNTPFTANLNDDDGDGKIDGNDVADVIVPAKNPLGYDGKIVALDGATGKELWRAPIQVSWPGNIAVGDIDGDGKPEVVVIEEARFSWDRRLMILDNNGNRKDSSEWHNFGAVFFGTHESITLSDLDADGKSEILWGINVHDCHGKLLYPSNFYFNYVRALPVDLDGDGYKEIVASTDAISSGIPGDWGAKLTVIDYKTKKIRNRNPGQSYITDPLIGAIDSSGKPFIISQVGGTQDSIGEVDAYSSSTLLDQVFPPIPGHSPELTGLEVDAFSDYGFYGSGSHREVYTIGSLQVAYVDPLLKTSYPYMVLRSDLQNRTVNYQVFPRVSGPGSSEGRGGLFDFNDDGEPESILETDDSLFILDSTATVVGRVAADGHRWTTGLTVADIDKDGHADIIVGRCYPANHMDPIVAVYSNPTWVGARSIYNQNDYTVTNVNDDGSIPRFPQAHWEAQNTANVQCTEGHYACVDISASFPQVAVNDTGGYDVTARIGNGGGIELPAGIPVAVYSDMGGANTLMASAYTTQRLKPGQYYTFHAPIPDGLRGTYHFRIAADDSGNGHGMLDENDEANNSVSVSFLVNDHAPVIADVGDQYAEPGEAFTLDIPATDADGDALVYSLVHGTPGMTLDSATGRLAWTPGTNPPRCSVTVSVADPYQRAATVSFLVFNGNRNNAPPVITSTPPTLAKLNTLTSTTLDFYRYDILATDPEGEALEYFARCLDCNKPIATWPTLTGNHISWSPFQPPWYEHDSASIEVTVRDARGGVATQDFVVHTIRSHNTPPQFIYSPNLTVAEDQGWSFNTDALDFDNDQVTLILDTLPIGANNYANYISWTPPKPGSFRFRIGVTDGIDTTWKAFTLVVTPVNDAPIITSTAPTTSVSGSMYSYPVIATDEENDPLTYTLANGPAGMTITPAGVIQWRSPPARTAPADVQVQVQDPSGATASQAWQIAMRPDSVPPAVAIRFSQNPARPGHPVTVTVDASDNVAVASAVLTRDGSAVPLISGAYVFTPPDTGTYAFAAQAVDAQGNAGNASGLLRASQSANVSPPTVSITHTPANPHAGDWVNFQVTVTDSDGVDSSRQWVNVDGLNLPVAAGLASYQALRPGPVQAQAVAYDVLGNSALASDSFFVSPLAGDNVPPTAEITAPGEDSVIYGQADLLGTAADANLAYYTLSYREAGSQAWIEYYRSTANVSNGKLGIVDATTLLDGAYEIRLDVYDQAGNSASASVQIKAAGEKKVGPFTLSFQDLTLPMAGMELSVARTYDSRIKTQGDFGIGWQMGLRSIRLNESRNQGVSWSIQRTPGLLPNYYITEDKAHTVTVTLPGGRTQEFAAEPHFFSPYNPNYGQMRYTAKPGTYSTLEPLDVGNFVVMGDEFYDENGDFEEPFNPQVYKLTLLDGSYFIIDQNSGGVIESGDLNGNKVDWTANSIRHNAGESIDFARDELGRIISISDHAGRGMQYRYDVLGNLAEVVDADGHSTKFKYGPRSYLTEVIDARGIRAARTEYDDQGRVIRQINADGDTLSMDHDLAANTETIDDYNGNTTVYTYDSTGNVLSKTDADHHTWSYQYDSVGNVLSTIEPGGFTTSSTYDAKGNENSHTDEMGVTVNKQYDDHGHLQFSYDAFGFRTYYQYDNNGNQYREIGPDGTIISTRTFDAQGDVLTEADALGNVTGHTYSPQGWLTSTTDAENRSTSFGYDDAGHTVFEVNAQGDTTRSAYDKNGNRILAVDALGDSSRTEYNAIGKPVQETDALGRVTRFVYNNLGDKIQDISPDGAVTQRDYDAQGNVVAITDKLNRVTRMRYDFANRLIETEYPDHARTETVYDALGRRVRSIDANGNATRYEYDADGRNTKVTDALGHETQYTYDAKGRKATLQDALNQTTSYGYDAYDRMNRTSFADGTAQYTVFDADGRKISESDLAGKTTGFEYDSVGNLTAVVDAMNQRTEYGYDSNNNRLTQKDANGHYTHMSYDALGRMLSKTYPNGQQERWTYDAVGNSLSHVKGADSTAFAYDSLNRETQRSYFPGGHTVSTSYTLDGKRESVTDYRGISNFTYDLRGRLFREDMPNGDFLENAYDANGNRLSVKSPFGTTQYRYDSLNRMDTVLSSQNQVTVYRYNPVGNRDSVINANGTSTGYGYDILNRLTELRNWNSSGALISRYSYWLTQSGIRHAVTELDGSQTVYDYDNLYRLIAETRTGSHAYARTYTYDAVGNRLTQTIDGAETDYTYNSRDELLSESAPSGSKTYDYDAAGRMISKTDASGTTTYAWQDDDRMTSVSGPGANVQYVYDADGRRVKETAGGASKQYLIDPLLPYGQVIVETDGSNSLVAEYVYGTDRVSQRRGTTSRYFLADGQGSIRMLADSVGAVTDSNFYTAFGEDLYASGSTPHDFKYVGEQADANSGFYYLRARWMDPKVGRFASVDPYEGDPQEPVGLHRYLYANESPVSFADPSGEVSLLELSLTLTISSILTLNIQPAFGSNRGWGSPTRDGFDKLWANYPGSVSSDAVYEMIGGKVLLNHENQPDKYQNSCALRMSRALNYSGHSIPHEKDVTGSGSDKKWYYYTVENVSRFIRSTFGAPDKTRVTYGDVLMKRGIILFQTCGWDDATGHIDLWNKVIAGNAAHWDACADVSFWRFK